MNKLTQISGLNNKLGQNSRTGSNISIFVPDELIQAVTQYYVEVKANKETLGKVKKIELVIYEDGDELETIESLRAENKELKEFIESIDQPIKEAVEAISEVTEDIKEDLSTNGQANEVPKLKKLKCACGKTFEWANVFYGDEYSNIEYKCSCGCTTAGGKELTAMVLLWAGIQNDTSKLKFFIENVLEEEFHEKPNEHLPPNQTYLKLYEKSCKCETSAIVNGKCANCGGVE